MGVAKNGDYVYVASFSNHTCLVLDAKDPRHLKKLYSFVVGAEGATSDRLRKVVYHDGYLYLTHSSEGRLYIADGALHLDIGRGQSVRLPEQETERRWNATFLSSRSELMKSLVNSSVDTYRTRIPGNRRCA